MRKGRACTTSLHPTPPMPLVKTETEEVEMGVHTTHASKAGAIEAAQFRC
jgi:hypothetical protein